MRCALPATVLCALVAALAACGEKDESDEADPVAGSTATTDTTTDTTTADGGSSGQDDDPKDLSPEELIEAAIVAAVGGGDPRAACVDLVTPAYVETAYGDDQGCRAAVKAQGSFNVKVDEIEINAARATAIARPSAGPNMGEKLTVRLVEEGRAWKVDFLRSNAPAGP